MILDESRWHYDSLDDNWTIHIIRWHFKYQMSLDDMI